ncbi:uncharacterized protein LOC116203636 [Punica granatum]|uniref:Uncharacterized protein LOC116203636 n=1 Tax=Punica granatum TaxID=22663 RepID=A0A218X5P7_PUNGR|nr:uncharacterized protein LOC116203636 [Punica granatum]OWM79692.1 hypothetical protein CDL15_Pgr023104 [Punica granatum]
MKSWHCNGESSSLSSNLSAFAPPFTVSPFAPSPGSNPYEPLLGLPSNSSLSSCMGPNPHMSASDWAPNLAGQDFDSMNYLGGHEYPPQAVVPEVTQPFSYGQLSDGLRTNVDEVRPYYPQYYYSKVEPEEPSAFTNHPGWDGRYYDKNQVVSGLDCPVHVGETFSDTASREQHELVKLEGGYCPEQGNAADSHSYMNQGTRPLGFGIHAEASNDVNLLERGKLDGPKCQGAADTKFSLPNNSEFTAMTCPTTLDLKYSPLLPAAHPEAPPLDLFLDLRKDTMKHNNIVQKCMRQSGSSPGDENWDAVFPALSTRPPASAPVIEVLSGNHGNGSLSASGHFSGSTVCSVRDTDAAKDSERDILFDVAQSRYGHGRGDGTFGILKDEDFRSEKAFSNDASVHLVRENPRLQVPCTNVYGPNASSFEAFSHFNHSLDSPCWKGVPIGHFGSSFDPSVVPPKHLSGFKEFNDLNPQRHQVSAHNAESASKFSSQRLNEAMLQIDNRSSERKSMFHQEQPCVFNPSATEQNFHDALEIGSPHLRQKDAHFNELTSDCSFELPRNKPNSSENELNPEERKLSGHEGLDTGRNISDDSNNGFSDVSVRCVEHVLSSPPTLEATKHSEWSREELTARVDVSMVVRMMHNLSELLMTCSSSGACNLKEQDCEVLKNVTNNLIIFCLENRHLATTRNSNEPKTTFVPDGVFLGEFPGVHATLVEVKRPELLGEVHDGQGKPLPVLIPPFVGREKNHRAVPNNPDKTSSDFSVLINQSNVIRDDKMIQSGVVEEQQVSGDSGKPDGLNNNSEQHCNVPDRIYESSSDHTSVSVLPNNIRDDKMTQAIKMILEENFHEEDEAEPQVQLFKNLWLEAEAALCSMNYRARYDRLKFEMEKSKAQNEKAPSKNTIAVEELLDSGVSANLGIDKKTADDASKNHENMDISAQKFSLENDVMARFNILKDRDSKSNLESALDGEDLASHKVSYDLNEADEVASGTCESPASPVPTISPVKGSANPADNMDSSIFSRLSILKQREENPSLVVNLEPDLSQHNSGRSLVGREDSMGASVWGRLSILKQREEHSSSSEVEVKKPSEGVNLESSVLSRLNILKQRDDNLSSMGWDCTPPDVNLESVVKKDYFPSIGETTDTKKDFSSGFINYGVPESQRTGGCENPMHAARICDFSSSSDWEHVLKEEV